MVRASSPKSEQACEKAGVSQAAKITELMLAFVEEQERE